MAGNTIERIAPFLCSPFRLNIQLALAMNQSSSMEDELGCTLTDVENNFRNFTDGTGGGWSNWFQITQNPQNNPYGAMMIAKSQLSLNIETAQGKYKEQLDWGSGFLSFESCPAEGGSSKQQVSGTPAEVKSPEAGPIQMPGSQMPPDQIFSTNSNTSTGFMDSILSKVSGSNSVAAVAGAAASAPKTTSNQNQDLNGTLSANTGSTKKTTSSQSTTNWSLLSGTSLANSNSRHIDPNDPTKKRILDANDQPVYGVQAGDNGCVTQTPGAAIESQLSNTLGSDLRGLEIAQSIDQIVAALVGQLVTQAMGGIGGLMSAGSGGGGGGSAGNSYQNLNSSQNLNGSSQNLNYQASLNGVGGNLNSTQDLVPNLPITGSCTTNKQNAQIGESVTWSAYVPDINGSVKYTWYGDEDLSGRSSSVTKTYTTNGAKTASVIVETTGTNPQTAQIDCVPGITIGNIKTNSSAPTISCAVSPNSARIGTPVTWQAVVTGGSAPFIYSWEGSNGLSATGQSVIKSYSSTGLKTATVYVTGADGSTYSNQCATGVNITP